jgi:hypothetical protein
LFLPGGVDETSGLGPSRMPDFMKPAVPNVQNQPSARPIPDTLWNSGITPVNPSGHAGGAPVKPIIGYQWIITLVV